MQTLRACAESSEVCEAFPESEGALAILISHDCDVVNDSLTREPSAYWLIARRVKDLDCVYLYGQNPRKLQFEQRGILYEVLAREFFSTPRGVLETASADETKGLSVR